MFSGVWYFKNKLATSKRNKQIYRKQPGYLPQSLYHAWYHFQKTFTHFVTNLTMSHLNTVKFSVTLSICLIWSMSLMYPWSILTSLAIQFAPTEDLPDLLHDQADLSHPWIHCHIGSFVRHTSTTDFLMLKLKNTEPKWTLHFLMSVLLANN